MTTEPLTNLLKKGEFKWNEVADAAFKQLKFALIIALVLALANMHKPFTIETDASNTSIRAVLIQDKHRIAFISKILSPKNQLLSVMTGNSWP